MFYIKYLGALIYDVIILITLFVSFTASCLPFRYGNAIPPGTLWYQLILLTIVYCYYSLSCHRGGQTIGMRAWNIQLKSRNDHLSQKQITKRFFLLIPACLFSIICFKNPLQLLERWTKSHLITNV